MSSCVICGSSELSTIVDYKDYPYFTVPVALEAKQKILSTYSESELIHDLNVEACANCGHCRHSSSPDFEVLNDLYSNYYSYPSPLENNYEPVRDNQFLKVLADRLPQYDIDHQYHRVYEIGCYDGYILYHLQKQGFDVEGCDPSAGALIGKRFGVKIQKELFDPKRLNNQYDIVISRHYLEHVLDPFDWINAISKAVSDEGMLIVEVPNVAFYINNGLSEVFSHQHIHGFSSDSIQLLLNKLNIHVDEVVESENNLIVFASKSSDEDCHSLSSHAALIEVYINARERNQDLVTKVLSQFNNKRIAIWGAGGFGISVSKTYNIPLESINYFIDSDPAKNSMEYISLEKKIVAPSSLKEDPVDLIVIASMYGDNIMESIKNNGVNVSVLTLYPSVQFFEQVN